MGFDINDYIGKDTFIGKLGDFAGSDAGKGLTSLAGLGMSGYGMYKQNKLLNKQNDLLTQNYNYNKMLNNRHIAQQNLGQENFSNAYDSVFGTQDKKKKNLGDYAGMYNFKG